MTRRLGRSPTLDEVISVGVEHRLDDLHVAMPGKVVEYNAKEQKASIKPLLRRSIITPRGDEIGPESLPIIPDVPVMFPRAGDFFISFPLKKDDHVLLVFCERSIDSFITGDGNEVNPIDLRMHDLNDAVAYPGLYPFTKPLKDASSSDLVVGKDGDISIQIREKQVEVKDKNAPQQSATIAEALQSFYGKVVEAFNAHTHPTGVGPSSTPTSSLPDWEAGTINSNKVKIPGN